MPDPDMIEATSQRPSDSRSSDAASSDADSSDHETTNERTHQPHASPFYNHLVPAYQALWPAMAKKRIEQVVSSMDLAPNARLLEVGVGTGLSLPAYPTNISITGVDLSEAMLAEAKQTIREKRWDHINVEAMNAEQLTFDDNSFDIVTSFHTISVVSDPRQMMSEMIRVCKPGGQILIINHFRSGNPLIAKVVDQAGNITRRLGWRTDLDLQEVVQEMPLRMDQKYKTNPMSLFTIMLATCKPDAVAAV